MNCPACEGRNPDGMAFCGHCGAALRRTCANCGGENSGEFKFCGGCGKPLDGASGNEEVAPLPTPERLAKAILRDRSKIEGERRVVTVLFADAVGHTELAEELGSEDVYRHMQGCFARMQEAVHKYDGTVNQFTGDGILALFGAPIAHEDSARRAVAAALEMQRNLVAHAETIKQKHDVTCGFRVGLNTGEVVVGSISDNLDLDFAAVGDTVNLAARMESLAEPGTVCISGNTYRSVRDYFECEDLGPQDVKGKASPVRVYRPIRERPIRTRFEAATARGLTPYTGRTRELNVLLGYLDEVSQGHGHILFVHGEAGIGKSRLLLEFQRRASDRRVRWLTGHCISFGKHMAYLPLIDVLKANFGVEEGDDEAAIIRRIDERVSTWDRNARASAPYLKYLLQVDPGDDTIAAMNPLERRAGFFDAFRALLHEECRDQSLIIAIEDVHWIDKESEEALTRIIDVVATLPVLVVLTSRPGYRHSLGDRSYFSRLALNELAPADTVLMAEQCLQAKGLPSELSSLIAQKTEGNPFFVEEVTKTLVETGILRREDSGYVLTGPVDESRIPDSIQEVILARMDRLAPEAKQALQLASVIGREFTVRLLQRISDLETQLDSALGELRNLELIYETGFMPELSYMFKHALTHDVAYSTLLIERRRELHRIVAEAMETLYADRLPEHYEALAYHYYEGQNWEKALVYLTKAAEKARDAYANADAIEFFGRAIAVCEKMDPRRDRDIVQLAEQRGHVYGTIGEYENAVAEFDRMRNAAAAVGDRESEGLAVGTKAFVQWQGHDFAGVDESAEEALEIAAEGYEDLQFFALTTLWYAHMTTGRLQSAKKYYEEAKPLADRGVGNVISRIIWGSESTMAHYWRGAYDSGLQVQADARPESKIQYGSLADSFGEVLCLGGIGEYGKALDTAESALALCERLDEKFFRIRMLNTVGWLYAELELHGEAKTWNERCLEEAARWAAHDVEVENHARINLGDNLQALGDLDGAEQYYTLVESMVKNPKPRDVMSMWNYTHHLFHSFGELWLKRGDLEKAWAYATDCLERAVSQERPKNQMKARRLRGEILMERGDLEGAEEELRAGLAVGEQNPAQRWKTLAVLGEVLNNTGRTDEAAATYADAAQVIDGIAEKIGRPELVKQYLAAPRVASVREAMQGLNI